MNEKDSKVPVYIAILIAVILVGAAGFYVLGGKSEETPGNDAITPVVTPKQTPVAAHPGGTPTTSAPVTTATTSVATIKCELCHTNPQNLVPHLNGGKLCMNCHGSQVHSIHMGTGTVNLNCDICHGSPQKITIPKVETGEGPGHFSTCEQCHAPPPDSLKPSNGELVEIHLSRSKYCTNCHGSDVGVIHEKSLNKTP